MQFTLAGRVQPGLSGSVTGLIATGKIVLLLAAFALTGCATAPSELAPEAAAKLKTVGIISAIGDTLNYEQVAITAFSNDLFHKPVGNYGIDKYVTDLIARDLGRTYEVRPVQYDPASFAAAEFSFSEEADDSLGKLVRANATPNNLDAYIVVLSAGSGIDVTNQVANGLGVARRAMAFYHLHWAHALYGIAVVDGHTGKVLAWHGAPGGQQELGLLDSAALAGPYKDVDETYWPEDPTHISDAQAKRVVDLLKELIAQSMNGALQNTGLLK
jgi:hypothetical protein